jgi:hypothetical protein
LIDRSGIHNGKEKKRKEYRNKKIKENDTRLS